MNHCLQIVRGDISRSQVDVVVNAADPSLLGGGGVDGALHRAAGPDLRKECQKLGGCAVGQVKVMKAYRLPAKWIIHTVGPVWEGGFYGEYNKLANCYRSCLRVASKLGARGIAFPSISTGYYWFPVERAARIALKEILAFIEVSSKPAY